MNRSLIAALSLGVLAIGSAAPRADDITLAPRKAVLLLNNGELIEGTITVAGDRYDVVGQDSEIRIKRSDVAMVCRDCLECYDHKRSGIEQGRVQDHLELAEWCLKHGLLEPAETQLEAARAADSAHPRIRLLEPRFELARQSPANREPAAARDKLNATEQLDGMARSLPAGSMEKFTNGIQPMLLNYCAKSGCHGPRSAGGMRLERIGPNRLAGRHATQGNLQAVLAMVNREAPQESKLLAAPIRPHGNMKAPVFTDRDHVQYKQLIEWVYQVSSAKKPAPPPTLEERSAPLLQAVSRAGFSTPTVPQQHGPAPSKPQLDPQDWSDSFPDQAGPSAGPEGGHGDARAAQSDTPAKRAADGQFVPRDPFDPEIFNRRFFGK